MYLFFYENKATGSQIHRSFILIGPSVTMLFVCVQLSLPLSLGLLGALSIVRFRTPIKEPEEIGFLMLLIAASIGIATFNFLFVLLLYIAVFAALLLRAAGNRALPWTRHKGGVLLLNLSDEVYRENGDRLQELLKKQFKGLSLESMASTEGTTNLQYLFARESGSDWNTFQKSLHEAVPYNKMNMHLTSPARIP
jgi:hypothetical protein